MNWETEPDLVKTISASVFCKTSGLRRFHQSELGCVLRRKYINFLYLLALHTIRPFRTGSAWTILRSILYLISVGVTTIFIILKLRFYAFFRFKYVIKSIFHVNIVCLFLKLFLQFLNFF